MENLDLVNCTEAAVMQIQVHTQIHHIHTQNLRLSKPAVWNGKHGRSV